MSNFQENCAVRWRIAGNLAPCFARRSGRVQSYTPLASRLQNPTLPRTASADWKQAVSSATASGRKICQNHFFKNQIILA